jgi:hypothetical protein
MLVGAPAGTVIATDYGARDMERRFVAQINGGEPFDLGAITDHDLIRGFRPTGFDVDWPTVLRSIEALHGDGAASVAPVGGRMRDRVFDPKGAAAGKDGWTYDYDTCVWICTDGRTFSDYSHGYWTDNQGELWTGDGDGDGDDNPENFDPLPA